VLDRLFTAQLTLDEAARDVGELVAVVAGVSAQHGERLVHGHLAGVGEDSLGLFDSRAMRLVSACRNWALMVSLSAAAFSLTMATLAKCTRA
jgi:hypothetical protein